MVTGPNEETKLPRRIVVTGRSSKSLNAISAHIYADVLLDYQKIELISAITSF
jgi:hypothetical protein